MTLLKIWLVLGPVLMAAACRKPVASDAGLADHAASDRCREDCVQLRFAVDNRVGNDFYSMPFPMDIRAPNGYPDYTGYPDGKVVQIQRLVELASHRKGASVISAVFFGASGEMQGRNSKEVFAPSAASKVIIVDVTPNSPDAGTMVPAVADTFSGLWQDLQTTVLAVAPAPGSMLKPRHTYAYLVKRTLGDARGRRLGVHPQFSEVLAGRTPVGRFGLPAVRSFAPAWPVLEKIGVKKEELAGMSVITTGDAVAETATLTDKAVQKYSATLKTLDIAPGDGANLDRFCEFHATVEMPQFQTGTPPFDREGYVRPDANGELTSTRTEMVPISISLPRKPMPQGGFPTMFYLHGSGGTFTQAVDRGARNAQGEPAAGKGPAFVMARHGFATIGVALPLNVDRFPAGGKRGYLNFKNLAAYPGTFLQGIIEQRLFIKMLGSTAFSSALVQKCRGLSVSGTSAFDTSRVHMLGQSHGSAYAYFLGAVEPKVKGVVLTGAGGYWSLLMDYMNMERLLGVALFRSLSMHNHLHPTARLLQDAWEPAEAIVYAPRIAHDPLPGHPVRSVFLPAGQRDPDFPEPIFDAMAAALGVRQAGTQVWPGMQTTLGRGGFLGIESFPVRLNVERPDGVRYTGVVMQYPDDRKTNMHHIFSEWDSVKHQYGCFLATLHGGDAASLVVGKDENSPCE